LQIRNLLYGPSRIFHPKFLARLTSRRVILPFYHTVSDVHLPHISNLYTIRSVNQFKKDLEFLCRHFKAVDLDSLYRITVGHKSIKEPIFHLSFDDGLSELYSVVAPLLVERGIPASIFVNTDFVGNKQLFYRYKVSLILDQIRKEPAFNKALSEILELSSDSPLSIEKQLLSLTIKDVDAINSIGKTIGIDFPSYLNDQQPYLNKSQIHQLVEWGFQIGSHSCNHPFFKHISLNQQKEQLLNSFQFLENELKIKERYFSYPFSDEGVGKEFFNWLYDQNCKLSFGTSGLKSDDFKRHLHRIPFDGIPKQADEIVKAEYLYYMIKRFFDKNRIKR